ncbi:hypothetical protein [Epilithonimonas sp. UC225_85]|uniref:hypothetical protein n=1 Tax=Epilithonimonas sp. UC225_85 TaxID=3350167 RepID=UPI0036D2A1F1
MSTSEKGHARNLANANLINSYITQLIAIYKPSNPHLAPDKLQTLYSNAFSCQQNVNAVFPPYTFAVDARKAVFAPVSKKVTKLRKVYKTTHGVTEAQMEDFMAIARKLKGVRKAQPDAPVTPETEQSQHSVSQMSYDQRTSNYGQMIQLLQMTPNYAPNETEYQIATLQEEKEQMMQSTQQVADTYFPLSMARDQRNKIMYTDINNLLDTFNKARDYLFTILDNDSVQYKDILKIKFKKP